MSTFERDCRIFRDKDVLSRDYHPEAIQGRDEEMEAYVQALQPVIDGWSPNNVFLYGNTGVGKTAVTEHLLGRLQEDAKQYPDLDLHVVRLNCQSLTSSYQVAIALVNELRQPQDRISPTGHPASEVYGKLFDEIDALGGTVLLVLDEIDAIGSEDTLLYELPRARSKGDLERAKTGIIGISNDLTFRDDLDPRVRDALCERELHFSPYDAPQLQAILRSRAAIAIADDALEDGVVELCAALAARDRGSARQAIDLLRVAGEIARQEDANAVTESHVEQAKAELEREQVVEGVRELTVHGQYALVAVLSLAATGRTPARGSVIYDRYTDVCRSNGTEALTRRSLNNHLADLRMFGVLTATENRTGSRGNYYTYDLAASVERVRTVLKDAPSVDVPTGPA